MPDGTKTLSAPDTRSGLAVADELLDCLDKLSVAAAESYMELDPAVDLALVTAYNKAWDLRTLLRKQTDAGQATRAQSGEQPHPAGA